MKKLFLFAFILLSVCAGKVMAQNIQLHYDLGRASAKLPSLTSCINAGILIDTGHPFIHCAFLQFKHLLASAIASSLL